ncbi:hypothetical protein EJD97_012415 [Solanum chilense]|uniref:Neprosin activation peptide domain-containing protein n=1 Tax=Solanum chilense TaxID=4083 RepID=A0A6N2BLS9_SOLCI|nr:hypothetical protein EJD97_012415 [Solanum chilense]
MMKNVTTNNVLLLKTIFVLCSILIVTQGARIGRREIESRSGIDVFKMDKNTNNIQSDDSIVIDYAPAHPSPSRHHDKPPPYNSHLI